jgi:hypothetical protein
MVLTLRLSCNQWRIALNKYEEDTLNKKCGSHKLATKLFSKGVETFNGFQLNLQLSFV